MGAPVSRCRRLAVLVTGIGLLVGPMAIAASAGVPPDLGGGLDPGDIDFVVDAPSDFAPDTGTLPGDAELQAIVDTLTPAELQAIFTSSNFPDANGDGIPDEGEPGDLDIRPGDQSLTELVEAVGGAGLPDDTSNVAAAIAANANAGFGPGILTDGGSKLQGHCAGVAISYDGDGAVIDAAVGIGSGGDGLLVDTFGDGQGERAFTTGNRFQLRTDGQVIYYGYLPYGGGDGARNHVWKIKSGALSFDSGGDDNPDGNNANAGVVDFAENIPGPLRFTGTIGVTGDLFSTNGLWCVAQGHAEFGGGFPPIAGGLATLLVAGGALGLLFNSRPAVTFKA